MDTPESPPSPAEYGTAETAIYAPLLNLDTLVIRPVIAIDGARYEILAPDELSIVDSHRFGVWGRRVQELADIESAEAEAELEDLVNRIARRVAIGVPSDVYEKLKGAHKQAVVDVFTGLLLRNRLGVAEAIARAAGVSPQTGAIQSQGSSDTSAAGRSGGWLKRLSAWFALS